MRVLILYNQPVLAKDHPDAESEYEILDTVEVVGGHLTTGGHEVVRLGVQHDPAVLLEGLRVHQPEVVFNLFEGLANWGETEAYAIGMMEWLGVPFTGNPSTATILARNKHLAKFLLKGAGIPTPDFFIVEQLPVQPCQLTWPVIAKPANQDASVGLDQGSVATNQQQLENRVAYLLDQYGPPVLVEEFIRGREFNVGLIENPELMVLPLAEIAFLDADPSYWPIVSYDAKWKPGCHEYEATPPRYPADVPPFLADRLRTLAEDAFRLLGCRDYVRVDFRVDAQERPYVLEVNPNPDFSPTAGLTGALISAGMTHEQFTLDLVRHAATRKHSRR